MDLGGILLDRRLGTWKTPDGQLYNCYEGDITGSHTFYDLDATALTGGSNFQRHDLGPDFYQEGISPLLGVFREYLPVTGFQY